ncbi:hypothetical protein G9A89_016556 [Geosiphon pyriformis]|nr:hypothetical protein G9A89_016556 [Geosiphon pyriformis]
MVKPLKCCRHGPLQDLLFPKIPNQQGHFFTSLSVGRGRGRGNLPQITLTGKNFEVNREQNESRNTPFVSTESEPKTPLSEIIGRKDTQDVRFADALEKKTAIKLEVLTPCDDLHPSKIPISFSESELKDNLTKIQKQKSFKKLKIVSDMPEGTPKYLLSVSQISARDALPEKQYDSPLETYLQNPNKASGSIYSRPISGIEAYASQIRTRIQLDELFELGEEVIQHKWPATVSLNKEVLIPTDHIIASQAIRIPNQSEQGHLEKLNVDGQFSDLEFIDVPQLPIHDSTINDFAPHMRKSSGPIEKWNIDDSINNSEALHDSPNHSASNSFSPEIEKKQSPSPSQIDSRLNISQLLTPILELDQEPKFDPNSISINGDILLENRRPKTPKESERTTQLPWKLIKIEIPGQTKINLDQKAPKISENIATMPLKGNLIKIPDETKIIVDQETSFKFNENKAPKQFSKISLDAKTTKTSADNSASKWKLDKIESKEKLLSLLNDDMFDCVLQVMSLHEKKPQKAQLERNPPPVQPSNQKDYSGSYTGRNAPGDQSNVTTRNRDYRNVGRNALADRSDSTNWNRNKFASRRETKLLRPINFVRKDINWQKFDQNWEPLDNFNLFTGERIGGAYEHYFTLPVVAQKAVESNSIDINPDIIHSVNMLLGQNNSYSLSKKRLFLEAMIEGLHPQKQFLKKNSNANGKSI